jgi:hypothetical protein
MKTRILPIAALMILFTSGTLLAADLECSLKSKNKASGRSSVSRSIGVVSKLYEQMSTTEDGYKLALVKVGENTLGITIEDLVTDTASSAPQVIVSSAEPILAFRSEQGLDRSIGIFCQLKTTPSAP